MDQELHKNARRQRELALLIAASSSLLLPLSSGCSGLSAWLEYNESQVAGCFVVPVIVVGATPEESAPKLIECPKPIKVVPSSP